ncbi:MAG TPA: AEC family transporter [Nanoarchaeota archaeon]|nr:AEC family transporter [Nanoarchaeota archaeon]
MNDIILKIIPVVLVFVLGYTLKRIGLLKKADADLFLRVVFYVALPSLVLLSITNLKLSWDLVYLPVIPAFVIAITAGASFLIGKIMHLERKTFGVLLIGTMIMNLGFAIPFIFAAYGEEGLARLTLFDFGNAILTFSFIYYIACRYGEDKKNPTAMIKKLAYSVPLWALAGSIAMNLAGIKLPNAASGFLQITGNMTVPLVMLSLGIYFSPKLVKIRPLLSGLVIRMAFGLFLGFMFVKLFHLEGLNRIIVIICSSAPIGYNTLTFSSLAKLDKEFAASLVSFSVLAGLVFIPILLMIL